MTPPHPRQFMVLGKFLYGFLVNIAYITYKAYLWDAVFMQIAEEL